MLEDDIYRSSTQYRLWSYTSDSLASLRSTTNALAAARVRDAIQRLRLENGQANAQEDVDCLTVDEEQKLVGFYCIKAMDFADFLDFPTNVKVLLAGDTVFWVFSRTDVSTGHSCAIPQTFLSLQLSNDIPSKANDALCSIPVYENGEPLYFTREVCLKASQNDGGGRCGSRISPHPRIEVYV